MTTREYAEAIMVWRDPDIADVEDIIKTAVAEEREECAMLAKKVLDERTFGSNGRIGSIVAEAIRARSNPAE